jgi:glyoxylase-like metal-dependent hydrolase (beta-lactamase superfamily II)
MLFDRHRRRLIAADVAYPEIRPYLEWGHTPDPVAEYLASLDRAAPLAPEVLLPGHGRPDDRPTERIAAARDALEQVRARVRAEVAPEPRTAYEITCRIAGDIPDPDIRGSWLSVSLCVLEHLEVAGDVVSETGEDGRRRWRGSASRMA